MGCSRPRRHKKSLDIDRLHVLNENLGMHVGDEVIVRVAEVIRRNLTWCVPVPLTVCEFLRNAKIGALWQRRLAIRAP